MLVAFCDQLAGNSTPSCRNLPTSASRISQSTRSNGCFPAWVKYRSILSPVAPMRGVAGVVDSAALRACGMGSPRLSGCCLASPWLTRGGMTHTASSVGRNFCLRDRQLAGRGDRLGLDAADLGLEVGEVRELPVDGGEEDARDRVEIGEAAQRQLADVLGCDGGGSGASDLRGD